MIYGNCHPKRPISKSRSYKLPWQILIRRAHRRHTFAGGGEERAGKRELAAATYRQLVGDGKSTPFAASASFRLPLLDPSTTEDAAYQVIAKQTPADGWYRIEPNGWDWGDSRKAALNELVRIRSNSFSVQVFEWLRSHSPFAVS